MVSMLACHAEGPGSIPGTFKLHNFLILIEIEAQFSLWRLEYETIIDKVTQQSQST